MKKIPVFKAAHEINFWSTEYFIKTLNVFGPKRLNDINMYDDVRYIFEGLILLNLMQGYNHFSRDILISPKSVYEAVDLVLNHLDLKMKVMISKMDLDRLLQFHTYFKNAFGLWNGNKELIKSCSDISKKNILDENDATKVILAYLWENLRKTHLLRMLK